MCSAKEAHYFLEGYLQPPCFCTGQALRQVLQILLLASRQFTRFLGAKAQISPVGPCYQNEKVRDKNRLTYLSRFLSFLLSSSRCLNFMSLLRSASMLWLTALAPPVVYDEVWAAPATTWSPPVAPLIAPVRMEPAPPEELFIRVESIDSSFVRTAARMTFLMRFNSVVKVKRASLELFSKF